MEKENFKIDFVGAGASRCGTTWISKCLAEHPEVCFSRKKEAHFFHDDNNFSKGLSFYKKFFAECPNNKIKGEFTPGYFANRDTARRISEYFKDVKIIFSLRNPIERAYSEYFYNKCREIDSGLTFEEALEGPFSGRYLGRGNYFSNIEPYLKQFPRKNILILIYEDIEKDPIGFMKNVYRFLGVDDSYVAESAEKYVNTSPVKEKIMHFPSYNKFITFLKRRHQNPVILFLRKVLKPLGVTKLIHWLFDVNYKHTGNTQEKKPAMKKETRTKLFNYYQGEIKKMEELLGRDLSFWK